MDPIQISSFFSINFSKGESPRLASLSLSLSLSYDFIITTTNIIYFCPFTFYDFIRFSIMNNK